MNLKNQERFLHLKLALVRARRTIETLRAELIKRDAVLTTIATEATAAIHNQQLLQGRLRQREDQLFATAVKLASAEAKLADRDEVIAGYEAQLADLLRRRRRPTCRSSKTPGTRLRTTPRCC